MPAEIRPEKMPSKPRTKEQARASRGTNERKKRNPGDGNTTGLLELKDFRPLEQPKTELRQSAG